MGARMGNFIKRSMHVSTRAKLPSELVPGYLYFVEDEGVILLRMEGDEVHTYAKQGPRGPQGPMGPQGPQGPAGPGYYSPPPDPLPNPPTPPSGEFPVGTMLQFDSLPYKVPDGGTWEVDVICTLSKRIGRFPFYTKHHNVRYKQTLTGGETLTLQKLIEGANEQHREIHRDLTLPKAELLANLGGVSIDFTETTWTEKTVLRSKENRTRHVPNYTPRPGKATRKS